MTDERDFLVPARRSHLRRSQFGTVELFPDVQRQTGWRLFLDGVLQSYVDIGDPTYLGIPSLRWVARVVDGAAPGSALHLGAGAMTLPRYLAATRPGVRQQVVDLNPDLLDLVATVLPPPGKGIDVRVGDGLEALAGVPAASVDLVVMDAFAGAETPEHLTGDRIVQLARQALTDAGVLVMNLADDGAMGVSRRQLNLLAAVFGHCALVASRAVVQERRRGNVVLAAAGRPLDLPGLLGPDADDPEIIQVDAGSSLPSQ